MSTSGQGWPRGNFSELLDCEIVTPKWVLWGSHITVRPEWKVRPKNPKGSAGMFWNPGQRLHGSSCHNCEKGRKQGREGLKWSPRFLMNRSKAPRLKCTWNVWGMEERRQGKCGTELKWAGTRSCGLQAWIRNLICSVKSAKYWVR